MSVYNGTSFRECTVHGKVQLPVHSNNFFLFFIVPLYIFNYFGSLYFSDEIILSFGMKTAFNVCVWAFVLTLVSWAGIKLFWNVSSYRDINGDVIKRNYRFHPCAHRCYRSEGFVQRKLSKHISIRLYFNLSVRNLWQTYSSISRLYKTRILASISPSFLFHLHTCYYVQCALHFRIEGNNGEGEEPPGIT